jgi:hypothetical protein
MIAVHLFADFLAGAFLCNALPHLASGLRGEPFPTPFAKPRGEGDSSPLINFCWGSFNLFAGLALVSFFPIIIGVTFESISFVAGFVVLGIHLSRHFGTVRKSKHDR